MREIQPSEYESYVLSVTHENVFSDRYDIIFGGTYAECKQWQIDNQHVENPPVIGWTSCKPSKWTYETFHEFVKQNWRDYCKSIGREDDTEIYLEDGGWSLTPPRSL